MDCDYSEECGRYLNHEMSFDLNSGLDGNNISFHSDLCAWRGDTPSNMSQCEGLPVGETPVLNLLFTADGFLWFACDFGGWYEATPIGTNSCEPYERLWSADLTVSGCGCTNTITIKVYET